MLMISKWNEDSASITGRVYAVQQSTNLSSGFSALTTHLPATPPVNAYTDKTQNLEYRFYRVEEDLPRSSPSSLSWRAAFHRRPFRPAPQIIPHPYAATKAAALAPESRRRARAATRRPAARLKTRSSHASINTRLKST